MDDTEATLCLLLARGVGPRTLRSLRRTLGSDHAALHATERDLARVPGIGPRRASAVHHALARSDPGLERRRAAAHGASIIHEGDARYPALLAAIPDPPPLIWVRGDPGSLAAPGIALVGSRRCSSHGRTQANRFASALAARGLLVVSGGARGIDAEAHRAAMRAGGLTVAVLGAGFDHPYPPEHATLYDRIAESGGAVVSEHPCAVAPRPGQFPRRNRIVSGLSLGVIVIEAPRRSGARITARLAAEEHGREVMAVPGRAGDPLARGCHELIRDGGAALVDDPDDVFALIEPVAPVLVRGAVERAQSPPVELSSAAEALLSVVTAEPVAAGSVIDQAVAMTGLDAGTLFIELTNLEFAGLVARSPEGIATCR